MKALMKTKNATMASAIAVSLLISGSVALAAGTSAAMGGGGPFADYDPIVAKYNASGEEFRIVGYCKSSCTLFLGIRNVCVDHDAVLWFHAARLMSDPLKTPVESLTNHLRANFKPALVAYLDGHGYLRRSEYHVMTGAEMAQFGYRICK
jgi:hypothetical protein